MKKAAFFNPYLDSLGGGERYFLTFASCLAREKWQVDLFWPDQTIIGKANNQFGIDLKRVNFVNINLSQLNLLKKLEILRKYDLSFYISDGSVPWLFAKKNILHFQVPFQGVNGRSWPNKLKLKKIAKIIVNSAFTKEFIDQEYGVKSLVVYPPVAVKSFKPGKKENIILSVGRFTDLLHQKRQDVLIEVFKNLITKGKLNWRLILAGGDKEGKKLVRQLREKSKGYPIEIKTNLSFSALSQIYSQAKIFWAAAGFGFNQRKQPERVEHFGIAVVEAMAAGCVPVITQIGGHAEIVVSGQNGLLWNNQQDLKDKTLELIKKPRTWRAWSKAAQKRARDFSEERFCNEIQKLVD
jgi:glycosyltransferase involved in cell wall biosynthesis